MEYLMTYGWAILIIAVVLGALFQLGVFNANNFAPKAPPGACRVFRPNGPGTASFINLEGVCSGELPQYVATYTNSYVQVNTEPYFTKYPLTVAFWINYGTNPVNNEHFLIYKSAEWLITSVQYSATNWAVYAKPFNGTTWECCSIGYSPLNINKWYHIVVIFSATGPPQIYINGLLAVTGSKTPPQESTANPVYIGTTVYTAWNGSLANTQIYNTSLSANEIQALYLEGIGGAPVDLQNLVGWWPLNGDANDYSGNGNNGQATAVTYTSSWTSGYTPP
jgi:hypothetical protein